MKKTAYFFLICMLFSMSIIAQITVTNNDLPKSGRVNILVHDTLSTINIGTAGTTAQTWDFTAVSMSYPQFTSYSSTAPYHQYAASFPEANIYTYGPSLLYGALSGAAPINYTNFGYMYLSSDVDGLSVIGYKSSYGITHQVAKDIVLQTPASLNDTYTDASYWQVHFNQNPNDVDTTYKSSVSKTITVDAFGTLTTNFGTFDVLRVHEHFVTVDSIFGSFGGTVLYSVEFIRDTVNNYHFWANGIGYPVAIVKTDVNNNIKVTEILMDTLSNYQISGTVYNTDGSAIVTSGRAQLIPRDQIDNLFGVEEEVIIDNNGHFQFSNVLEYGNFLVIAIPDAVQYPDLIPTYFGDEIYWQNASSIQVNSDTSINIYCQNNSLWQNYPGNGNNITGVVWADLGNNKGPGNSTPARGIRVTLEKNPGGEIIRHTETDDNGVYNFTDLPAFEYVIVVDIPAIEMDSTYNFNLTTSNNQLLAGYDFYYDSTKIYIYDATYISPLNLNSNLEIAVYPNPMTTEAFVAFVNNTDEYAYEFNMYDLTGKLVKSHKGIAANGFFISNSNISNGMYFYKLLLNNTTAFTGKIVVNN